MAAVRTWATLSRLFSVRGALGAVYNVPMQGRGALSDVAIEYPLGDGECQTCGKTGLLLARITSRKLRGEVCVCGECFENYRRGDPEVGRLVIARLRHPGTGRNWRTPPLRKLADVLVRPRRNSGRPASQHRSFRLTR